MTNANARVLSVCDVRAEGPPQPKTARVNLPVNPKSLLIAGQVLPCQLNQNAIVQSVHAGGRVWHGRHRRDASSPPVLEEHREPRPEGELRAEGAIASARSHEKAHAFRSSQRSCASHSS